jgi:uncharacterized protein YndB with AHSA1/START domain
MGVFLQSSELTVVRSVTIKAPAADVFPHVNDFHAWKEWSPWATLDPKSTETFDGPSSGKGAKFTWSGNNDVGEGTMTITDSQPNERIAIQLDFVRPMACTNYVEFTFKPEKDRTQVAWTMTGRKIFMAKAMGLFLDMDKMVGGEFDKGLASLQSVVEKGSGK